MNSIEQKAKAYDEAIEKIQKYVKDEYGCTRLRPEDIFPELKDEDEMIRKALIKYFSEGMEYLSLIPYSKKQCIAWLEKQGEQEPIVVIPKFRVGDTIRIKNSDAEYTITDISDGCYRGKGWCLDIAAGDKCGDYELVENKHAGWSKEDERNFDIIYGIIYNSCNAEDASRLIEWLKSLKDRVQSQPKQEWNEEDINMIDWLIRCCEKEHEELCNDKYGHQDIVSDLKRDCRKKWDWLESLKNRVAPQKQWKPSDEQLNSLYDVLNPCDGLNRDMLESLYQDLKKLKE